MSQQWPDPPAKLADEDIWICWRYEEKYDSDGDPYQTKIPLNPHTGRKGDATDPDKGGWTGFEAAVRAHENYSEADGIGFVFPENAHLAGVDLDDVRDPKTGEIRDWAREVLDTLDSYTELSPSETGYHIIVVGFKPGDRCKRKHDDGETEIECYDGDRFFTYTGKRAEGRPETVNQRHNELGGVYHEYLVTDGGADTDNEEQDIEPPDLDLDDEQVLDKARNANNGDKFERLWNGHDPNDDPSYGDKALCQMLAFWTGGDRQQIDRLFRASGRIRSKWDEDRGDVKYGERTIDAALSDQTEFYSPGGSSDGSEHVGDGDEEERELPTPEGLSLNNGEYGFWKTHDDEPNEWVGLTNFQLETNSFATDPDDPDKKQIDMTVHPSKGEPYDVVIPPTTFNEKREFKSNVVIGLTTTFSGKERTLNTLKTFVGTQDAPLRTGTYQMGRFGDEWVTPNGVLTGDGWSDEPEHIHVSRDIGAERKWALSPEDGDEFDTDEVRRILELLPDTRDRERFIPVLGWFYATPFKPLIHEWTGQFNLLGVLGETGAGKSATLAVLWELFGMGGDPLTADDTKYVLLTTLASTNSIPMWFDEYKPSDMRDWAVDTFWNEIRKTTRGGISARGNPDGSTTEYHLTAPAVVSGEERVHGSAEERRGIYTTFKKSPTDAGSESARAFADLVGGSSKTNGEREYHDGHELSDHALAYYQWALGLDDAEVQDAWRAAAKHVSQLLADHDIEGLEELVEQGLQTVKFGATMYRAFTDAMGGNGDVLAEGEIDDAILYVATNAIGGANRKSHLDVLFEVAGRAARHGYLEEGTHYKFVREGQADEELRLNLATGFDKIVRYAREHDVAEDLLNSKDDYYERLGDAIESGDGYIGKKSQMTPPIGRAVGVYVQHATDAIDGFDKGLFTEDTEERAEAEVQDRLEKERATEPVPTPLGDLSAGYCVLTVECVSRSTDAPNKISEAGVLRDATGTVDYIMWDGAEPVGVEEGETYRIEDANVGTDPDGAMQVELDGRITSAESISAGVGYLELGDPEGNARLGAAADGGEYEQAKPRMRELLEEHGPCSKGEWMAKAQQAGIERGAAEGAFESLKEQGSISELNGEWEVVQ